MHHRADSLVLDSQAIGLLDLSENLRLAENHGIEAGCDPEQVPEGISFLVAIEMLLGAAMAQAACLGQPGRDSLGLGSLFRHGVELDAVAGR